MTREKDLLLLQGRRRIRALSTDHRHIRLGDRKIGTGHIFVALRFLGALDRGHIAPRQSLLTLICRLALRQYAAGTRHRGLGAGEGGDIGRDSSAGAGGTRLLLGRIEGRQFLPPDYPVPDVAGQPGQGSPNLEPDPAEDPCLDRAPRP